MVFKTYQSAAPYGEIPSGHWGNQLLILFALINIRDNNHRKCKITLLSIWAVFSIFVCLATMMLKQHNWIDGPITFAICLLIWVTVTYWKWSTKVEFGFRWLNIKLGIEQPNEQTQTINNNRTFITLWCLYGVVLFYLIIVLWNSTVGAFLDAKIPYLVPTYPSSYTSEGVPFVNDSWKAFW
jgi:hypothetical protein